MPSRPIIARELAEIFKTIAHPDRIRLIEELRSGEQDVNTMAERLDLPGPRVSQHLANLRLHHMVAERREGRRHLYSLVRPDLADWIIDGLDFLEVRSSGPSKSNINSARRKWSRSDHQSKQDRA